MRTWLPSALLAVVCGGVAALAALAAAQTPAEATAASAAETFTYKPDGRRDPFVSLVSRGSEGRGTSQGGRTLTDLAVDDVSVRGIVKTPSGLVAMVQAPDGKTHLARPGDRLLDGTVKTVSLEGMVVLQEVRDPLSLVKEREVRKLLRGIEEGK